MFINVIFTSQAKWQSLSAGSAMNILLLLFYILKIW